MSQTQTITEIETVTDDLTAHEFDICCELDIYGVECDNPVRWIMHKVPHCAHSATHPALACDECKDFRMTTEDGVVCRSCGHVTAPARLAYSLIEPVSGKH